MNYNKLCKKYVNVVLFVSIERTVPTFVSTSLNGSTIRVQTGEIIQKLTCQAVGVPQPEIKWYKVSST